MKPEILESLQKARAAKRPVALATNLKSGAQKLIFETEAEGPLCLDIDMLAGAADMLKRIRDERGITIVWVEHIMGVLLSVVDRVLVLDHGAVIFEGTPRDAQQDERVAEVYLGPSETRAA